MSAIMVDALGVLDDGRAYRAKMEHEQRKAEMQARTKG